MKGMPMRPEMAFATLRTRDPKTETRRLINPQPRAIEGGWAIHLPPVADYMFTTEIRPDVVARLCDYKIGERRRLLTTWAVNPKFDAMCPTEVSWWLSEPPSERDFRFWHAGMGAKPADVGKNRPGRFLPNAMRHLMPMVDITAVSAEPLGAFPATAATAEGLSLITKDGGRTWKFGIADYDGLPGNDDIGWNWTEWSENPVAAYTRLWENINGPGSWALNPWVWKIQFQRTP